MFKKSSKKFELISPDNIYYSYTGEIFYKGIKNVWNYETVTFKKSEYYCKDCNTILYNKKINLELNTEDGIKKVNNIYSCVSCKKFHIIENDLVYTYDAGEDFEKKLYEFDELKNNIETFQYVDREKDLKNK
ncbi:hypothetical protein [Marinitoga litoralis]|uniref:hypothetical protein n=1 Tax=Marinitoga litoralis TaxID=570855 RepID=UPI001961E50E|nr:hypothetical protein [Marinitoga litoralis]MBM7559817.1 DNA-directed RNA polymerase subunit M/transcription elongation factor TFIIS [Marinitoga litoralis]